MHVIRNGFYIIIGIRVKMGAGLPLVTPALNGMKQVRYHAGFHKTLSMLVKIDSPGIARAFGEEFENVFQRMITPDSGIDADPFPFRRTGFADFGMGEDSMAAIEPAIGAPC